MAVDEITEGILFLEYGPILKIQLSNRIILFKEDNCNPIICDGETVIFELDCDTNWGFDLAEVFNRANQDREEAIKKLEKDIKNLKNTRPKVTQLIKKDSTLKKKAGWR